MLIDDGRGKLIDVRQEIIDFAIQMEIVMSEKDEEKGDSWKRVDIIDLQEQKDEVDREIVDVFDYSTENPENMIDRDTSKLINLMIDQTNYNMMLWNRLKEEN